MKHGLDSRSLLAAALWFVVIVPPAFGFWLVAGDLLGVPEEDFRVLLAASMLGVGIATLLQVAIGYLVPVYEGPAGNYLAAVAVLAVADPSPAQATGGLLVAAAIVFALGALRVDRILGRLFTPPVVQAFLFIIVLIALPPTIERALQLSAAAPLGTTTGWLSAAVVLGLALGLQTIRQLRAYALLLALVLGTAAFFALDGPPESSFESGGIAPPSLFPWGTPEISLSVAAPFAIAAVLASFNTVASMRVMAAAIETPPGPEAGRRGLLVDGGAQGLNACLGNLLGHVPRLDAAGVVPLIGSRRRLPLVLAAAAIIGLSFIGPVIDLVALLPVPVSAALLTLVLGMITTQGLHQVARMDRRSRWLVFAPAIVPCLVWLPVAGSLSQTAKLLSNPLLVGTVVAILLDRLVPPAALRRPKT